MLMGGPPIAESVGGTVRAVRLTGMSNRQRAFRWLSTLTAVSIVIAVAGIVMGVFMVLVSYAGSSPLLAFGYLLFGLGASFIPLAFLIGAISLHAQAIEPPTTQARSARG